ncbi:MAG TPA: VWA domain-containing protein [Thermoanaerobaculia bacterium]
MRSLLLLLLLAQTRETIDVRVTELEVTVLDHSGRAVDGLQRGDFEVRIGGKAVPVTNFFAVRNGAILDEERASSTTRELGAAQTSIPTTLVIFIDETTLRHGSRHRALEALERYVAANVGPMTTATLIRYNNQLDVRTRPTEKPGYILAELDKLERETFAGAEKDRERETMIQEIDAILFSGLKEASPTSGMVAGESPDTIFYRLVKYGEKRATEVDRTLGALENAIDLISGFAGRKVLLYVSEGLPQQPAAELFEYWDDAYRKSNQQLWRNELVHLDSSQVMRLDRTQQFQRVANTASKARVAIYSFDAGGVRGYEGLSAENQTMQGRMNATLAQANQRGGLQFVAQETGGRYIANENDVDKVLALMSEQFTTWYSIGVHPRKGDIEVNVKGRPELRVIAARRRAPRTRDEEIEQSVRTHLYTRTTENPLNANVELEPAMKIDGQCLVNVKLAMAKPQQLAPDAVEVAFVMLNERNDESEVHRVKLPFESERIAHAMTLRVQPQRHVLSMAITNPVSGEASYLQRDVDGTVCR